MTNRELAEQIADLMFSEDTDQKIKDLEIATMLKEQSHLELEVRLFMAKKTKQRIEEEKMCCL